MPAVPPRAEAPLELEEDAAERALLEVLLEVLFAALLAMACTSVILKLDRNPEYQYFTPCEADCMRRLADCEICFLNTKNPNCGWFFRNFHNGKGLCFVRYSDRFVAVKEKSAGDNAAVSSKARMRIDVLMVEQGLVPSRERAQALIMAGLVLVNEQKVEKSGVRVAVEATIRLLGEDLRYVSRGGLKLERALEHWGISAAGRSCLDVGASTGGFTDCLLQHSALRVIAIDTGYGQMAERVRNDPRVHLLEKTNARYLTVEALRGAMSDALPLQGAAAISLIAMDVSFISATMVLPAVVESVRGLGGNEFEVVVLVKPQFEVGREQVGKGGIVRDEKLQLAAVEKVRTCGVGLGALATEVIDSPILGTEGNREFLLWLRFG